MIHARNNKLASYYAGNYTEKLGNFPFGFKECENGLLLRSTIFSVCTEVLKAQLHVSQIFMEASDQE